MRYRIGFALCSLALLILLVPSTTRGQGKKGGFGPGGFGPGGGSGGFGGGGGGFGKSMNADPNQQFEFLAKGRPYFLVSESNRLRNLGLEQFLQDKNVSNGQVTRQLFVAFTEQVRARMGVPGGFSAPGGFGGGFGMNQPAQNPIDTLNQWAEADFKRLDRNDDGFLNQDEMPDQLRTELSKWDTNRDNLISLDEYKIYFAARMQTRGRFGRQPIDPITVILEDEELELRPVVYRAGKLSSKELPAWFTELDTDKDGQVALYEWRKAGKDLEEFREWDRNNDGFITAEEAIAKNRVIQLASGTSAEVTDSPATAQFMRRGGNGADSGSGEERGVKGKGGKGGKGKKGGYSRGDN